MILDSLSPGGAERSMAALAGRYRQLGIDLSVVYLKDAPHNVRADFEAAGAQCELVDLGSRGRAPSIPELARVIRAHRAELVHTTLFEADVLGRIAARVARVPVVSSIVNESYGPEHAADPHVRVSRLRVAQFLDSTTARLARRMHALTGHAADIMAKRLRYPRSRIDVIGRGRDPRALGERSEERRHHVRVGLSLAPSEPVVLAAARQEYQKGLDVLVRAAPAILHRRADTRIIIAGREGNETEQLHELTTTLGVEHAITFLGARDDVPDLLGAADVFVVPSRREGFGSVLLEGMALGVPIVASDLPPIREVLGSGHPGFVTAEDPDELAAAVVGVLDGTESSRAGMIAARQRFERYFTIDAIGDQMVAFYERALRKG